MNDERPATESIHALLELVGRFREQTEGILSSSIADENGLVVVSDDPGRRGPALAATGVLILRSATSAFTSLNLEAPHRVVVEGPQERAFVSRIGPTRFTLVVLADEAFDGEAELERMDGLRDSLARVLEPYS